jgi:penicillin-binding protein 1C
MRTLPIWRAKNGEPSGGRRARRLAMALAVSALVLGGGGLGLRALAQTVPLPARLTQAPSAAVTYRDGSYAHVFLAPDERWRVPVALEEVDKAYLAALIRLEDKRFWSHPGVDLLAVVRAAAQNLARGRRVSGASTLTLQLVRVLEPRPRTVRSKLVEALRALQLELRFSKQELLGLYLQFAPYGRNVEGVEAAALAYFGHRASSLSPAEIATLLAVPQNPNRRYPTPANAVRLRQARDEIAQRLLRLGALPLGAAPLSAEAALAQIRATSAPARLRPFPREAPHLAAWLKEREVGRLRIATTLDRGLQALVERTFHGVGPEARTKGIHHGAAVLLDHRTGEVVALVGGFDFWSKEPGVQLPAFAAPRSPGSLLKPFLYAHAIDRGLALPSHLVPDIPVNYGTYSPRNFDGRFDGLVTLEQALSRSLNVPFVELLAKVGVERFLGELRTLGGRSLREAPGHYGLSAIAGGAELTLLEVAGLYAALAQGGKARPLRLLADQEPQGAVQAFSEGAAYLTRRALALRDRPDFPTRARYSRMPPQIHWKTGTSFGHRDAWAAGSGPSHTAVVWMGNLDNRSSSELVGAEASGPLLFGLLEAVSRGAAESERRPKELVPVEVCAYSGHLPTEACAHTTHTLARRTIVPTRTCPYHVRHEVEVATGLLLSPGCREGRPAELRSMLAWPSGLRRWAKDQRRQVHALPAYAPGCQPPTQTGGPQILSPPAKKIALLLAGVRPEDQELALQAESDGARLSWFINGEFLGEVAADERLWWTPRPGKHEVLVTDDAGRSSRRVLEVATSLAARKTTAAARGSPPADLRR